MDSLEELGIKLRSEDAETRRDAAVALGRSGPEAVPLLLVALSDSDWRVRKTAVEALVATGGDTVISGLIETLHSSDNAGARNSAIETLVLIGTVAVDALLPVLTSPDPDVRKFIVDILGDIKDRSAVPALLPMLEDGDENIRVAAAEALGKIRDPRAVDALLNCLNRYDQGWLDYAAAEALGVIGDTRALGPLLAALGRSSLREPVLESLGKIGNAGTVGHLIASLGDPLRIVREVSISAIAAIFRKSESAERLLIIDLVRTTMGDRPVDFLEEILVTSGGDLQKATIALLGWTGRRSSIEKILSVLKEEELEDTVARSLRFIDAASAKGLIDYLESENALVRRTIARVLGTVACREAEGRLIGLLSDENGHVRTVAAEALGRIQSRKAVPGLIDLLEDEYEDVQESAISALAAIGDESVLEGLMKDFSSRQPSLRRNIALLLGQFRTDKAADALTFAFKDEEPDVRKAVITSLGKVVGARALKPLLLAVNDDDPEVRILAAEALGGREAPEAFDTLVALLSDTDLWVRAAAARGLGRTGGEKAGEVLAACLTSATDIFLLALIEMLGKLNHAPALDRLVQLTGHEDSEVRKNVLTALAGNTSEAVVQRAVTARLSDPHWSVRKAAVELLTLNRNTSTEALLETIADGDPDATVRQAAKEALGK